MEQSSEKSSKTAQDEFGEQSSLNTPTPLTLEENEVVYDDEFVVRETRFGLLKSQTIKDGKDYVFGPNTEQGRAALVYFTRQHLLEEKGLAHDHEHLEHSYSAEVGGKL